MFVPGTEMHIVTFIFSAIECILLLFQLTFFLSRPNDKSRLRYLILLILLIFYNLTSGFFPDNRIGIPVTLQNILAYGSGFIMASYFPYYLYKAFGLTSLRFHALYGIFIFLILPYILFFIVAYLFNDNLDWSRRYGLIIPFFYSISLLWAITKAVVKKFKEGIAKNELLEVLGVYAAVVPWASLTVVVYYDMGQPIEASVTNIGFLVVTFIYIRRMIYAHRLEYLQLQQLNETLSEKVRERTTQLELANEQRTNTFVNLMHETKTPLTLIRNYLEDFFRRHGRRKELVMVMANVEKLIRDVHNLFDLEKLEKGITYDHNTVVDFSHFMEELLVFYRVTGNKKGLEIKSTLAQDVFIQVDPVALQGIVTNLIENSLKFTKYGGIEVNLTAAERSIYFTVKDTGIGIPTEHIGKIFEPYYQISGQSNNQGMGLGLPLVHRIVMGLKGRVYFESPVCDDKGTKFTVELPRYYPEAVDHISDFSPQPTLIELPVAPQDSICYDNSRQTVLLIEDNLHMADYLSQKLAERYNVIWAENGQDAINKLKEGLVPDLVLSDVMMAQMDGIRFAEIFSETPAFNHIPLLLISAKNSTADRIRGIKAGAIDYIPKPFHSDELLLRIGGILEKSKNLRRKITNIGLTINGTKDIGSYGVISQDALLSRINENCRFFNLTPRESTVCRLVCFGKSYKEIAGDLFISEFTVKKHAQNIFEKLSVTSQTQLIQKLMNSAGL